MRDAAGILIHQQRQKFEADTRTWQSNVLSARSIVDALAFARREPRKGPLIRGLGSTTNAFRARALRVIDSNLGERLGKVTEAEKAACLKAAHGLADFPSVSAWLRKERQMAVVNRRVAQGESQ